MGGFGNDGRKSGGEIAKTLTGLHPKESSDLEHCDTAEPTFWAPSRPGQPRLETLSLHNRHPKPTPTPTPTPTRRCRRARAPAQAQRREPPGKVGLGEVRQGIEGVRHVLQRLLARGDRAIGQSGGLIGGRAIARPCGRSGSGGQPVGRVGRSGSWSGGKRLGGRQVGRAQPQGELQDTHDYTTLCGLNLATPAMVWRSTNPSTSSLH